MILQNFSLVLYFCFSILWTDHSDYFTSIAKAGAFASDHLRFRTRGPKPVSRSGHEVESHHRGVTDFEFQTGNSLITLQKWSCEVWSWLTTDCLDRFLKTDETVSLVFIQLGDSRESRKTVLAPPTGREVIANAWTKCSNSTILDPNLISHFKHDILAIVTEWPRMYCHLLLSFWTRVSRSAFMITNNKRMALARVHTHL